MTHLDRPAAAPATPRISLGAAAALGIGGMMGSGIFTLLGLTARTAGPLIPVAFLVSAIAASFSVYSYAKLGATFPSRGGAAEFLRRSFPSPTVSGGLNVFQYLAYLVGTALYAAGFAEYVKVVAGAGFPSWGTPVAGVAVVVVFALVSLLGSKLTDRAESVTVGVTLAILTLLAIVGAFHVDPTVLASDEMPQLAGVFTAAGLLYVNYQGFGVVTNASSQMANPRKELPRAMFTALGIVLAIYLLVSTLTVLVLSVAQIEADSGHVLATVATAVAGRPGFIVVSAAAILSSASAVNATIFAASSIASDVAKEGQLPRRLTATIGRDVPAAMLASVVIVIALVLFFPLDSVGSMTSLAFLLVYGAVSVGHLRVREQTGAPAWPLALAVGLNAVLFVLLLVDSMQHGSPMTWVTLIVLFVGSFAFETVLVRRHRPAATAN